jgi:hypothetical protein
MLLKPGLKATDQSVVFIGLLVWLQQVEMVIIIGMYIVSETLLE